MTETPYKIYPILNSYCHRISNIQNETVLGTKLVVLARSKNEKIINVYVLDIHFVYCKRTANSKQWTESTSRRAIERVNEIKKKINK